MPGRLIDADALWEELDESSWYDNADRDEIALMIVDTAPTVDAVPVVRCKDCVFYDHLDCYMNELTRPDDFCSHGVRKDEAE